MIHFLRHFVLGSVNSFSALISIVLSKLLEAHAIPLGQKRIQAFMPVNKTATVLLDCFAL